MPLVPQSVSWFGHEAVREASGAFRHMRLRLDVHAGAPREKNAMTDREQNKSNVVAFYDLMFNKCDPAQAVALYVGADYIQHNPLVATGKAAFVQYFEDMARRYPGKSVEFKRVFADGSFVLLHCHQVWPGLPDYAGIDIFRLDEQGKIVEHWDVLQEIPKDCAHMNGMF